jgi:MFS family permease
LSAFADALVMIALAGTLFFTVPTDEARGNVALYLALTMAPFAIVAPLIGPFLDRFSHGRRWAIGVTAAARGFLAWVAADAVLDEGVWLFPAALGILVGQKAYAVTRAAAVPRLLPPGITLVAANSRLQLAATFGTMLGAPVGLGLAQIGDDCVLRQNVTIGQFNRGRKRTPPYAPKIGNGVEVGAGAVVVGGITVGDGTRIGPNAVVMTDIPPGGSAFAGPAKIMQPLRRTKAAEPEKASTMRVNE